MKILERMAKEMPMKNCFRSEGETRRVEGLLNELRSVSIATKDIQREDRLLAQREPRLQFSFVIVHHSGQTGIECFRELTRQKTFQPFLSVVTEFRRKKERERESTNGVKIPSSSETLCTNLKYGFIIEVNKRTNERTSPERKDLYLFSDLIENKKEV